MDKYENVGYKNRPLRGKGSKPYLDQLVVNIIAAKCPPAEWPPTNILYKTNSKEEVSSSKYHSGYVVTHNYMYSKLNSLNAEALVIPQV